MNILQALQHAKKALEKEAKDLATDANMFAQYGSTGSDDHLEKSYKQREKVLEAIGVIKDLMYRPAPAFKQFGSGLPPEEDGEG